ncbi:MAG: GntR family transcriptional regulator [Pseudomonadota bacterium]
MPPTLSLRVELTPPTSLTERTYQELRGRILDGRLAPGTTLSERRLAELIEISRTPLRAALGRLEGEGLVERLPNRGIAIRRFSVEDLFEILVVRRPLEAEAAGLAAGRIDLGLVTRLTAEAERFARDAAPDFDHFWAHDDRLHDAIAEACGYGRLTTLIQDLRGKARMCHVSKMPRTFRAQGEEHLRILHALRDGASTRAEAAMRAHLDAVRRRLVAWLGGDRRG